MIGGGLRTAAAFGAGYGLFQQIKSAKAYKESLVDLAVNAGLTNWQMSKLDKKIIQISNTYGIAKEGVRDYVAKIVEQTGNIGLATGSMEAMTKVAYATGASLSDVAAVTVQVSEKAKIGIDKMGDAWGILASQAQKGSIEVKDMAREMPKIVNQMTGFGHVGERALRTYGALFQIARRGTTSASEAANTTERFLQNVRRNRTKIEKAYGIKLTDKSGKFKDLQEMAQALGDAMLRAQEGGGVIQRDRRGRVKKDKRGRVIRKTAAAAESELFGILGVRLATELKANAKRRATGEKGGFATFEELAGGADKRGIDKMAKRRREAAKGLDDFKKTLNKFKNQLYQQILPALTQMLPSINELAKVVLPAAITALKLFIDNWKIIAAIFVSNKLRTFLTALGGGGRRGPGLPPPPGRPGRAAGGAATTMGVLSTLVEGAAIGTAITKVGMDYIYGTEEQQNKRFASRATKEQREKDSARAFRNVSRSRHKWAMGEQGTRMILRSRALRGMVAKGFASPEEREAALTTGQQMLGQFKGKYKEFESGPGMETVKYSLSQVQKQALMPEAVALLNAMKTLSIRVENNTLAQKVQSDTVAAGKAATLALIQAFKMGGVSSGVISTRSRQNTGR
jgi:hypothetical protein